ncbi:hypothetical protein DFJ73DRAFT_827321 [Zopfochytrium polystomum]|nr:hypothetical protein DFJ73DRAFT_831027 [Zopfochytrium polystomum]KAI9354289.1 hypothetical protein DFJ73DRAFT_827321 [Zopfochytrium polystomum]
MMQLPGSPLVYCDMCGRTWCQFCLSRASSRGVHSENSCRKVAVEFSKRYMALDDGTPKKLEIDKNHPWLAHYARWFYEERKLHEWVAHNASVCPTCSTPIVKDEGCMHITCIVCDTHYCYECGNAYDDARGVYIHSCTHDKVASILERLNLMGI